MVFLIAPRKALGKAYSTATAKFDLAISARAFALLFYGLAGLATIAGLAINLGLAAPPVVLPALIIVAAILWLACFVLVDKRVAIRKLLGLEELEVCSGTLIPNLDTPFRSFIPPSEDRPPRSTPRAKS